jgi:hypothetical protein
LIHAANTVRLAGLLSSPECVRINLAHEWSLKVVEDGRDIQLHANRADEGRAVLLFTSIDLSRVKHFTCQLTIPNEANPIRVRADLVSPDRTQSYSSDKILSAHGDVSWDFAIPEKLRAECKVSLSVEMADPADAITNAFVHITDPRFVSELSELSR